MYQNYNYYPQQQQQPQITQSYQPAYLRQAPVLKGRLVSSLEEARATSIDFDGSVFYFPDLANKLIYTKQINMDGTATLNVYELRELPVEKEQSVVALSMDQCVKKDEFERALAELRESLVRPVVPAPQRKEILDF